MCDKSGLLPLLLFVSSSLCFLLLSCHGNQCIWKEAAFRSRVILSRVLSGWCHGLLATRLATPMPCCSFPVYSLLGFSFSFLLYQTNTGSLGHQPLLRLQPWPLFPLAETHQPRFTDSVPGSPGLSLMVEGACQVPSSWLLHPYSHSQVSSLKSVEGNQNTKG